MQWDAHIFANLSNLSLKGAEPIDSAPTARPSRG